MNRFSIRDISIAGLIAALYAVLSLAFAPISFGVYQVRLAEALTVLPFFIPAAIPGLYIGCLLANIFGNLGWLDIVIGPLITLVAALLTRQTSFLGQRTALIPAGIPILLAWLGAVYLLSAFTVTLQTILGFLLALIAPIPLALAFRLKTAPVDDLRERLGTRLIVSLILAMLAVILLTTTGDAYFIICGALLMVAAIAGVAVLAWSLASTIGPRLILAPLPPVLLNAFGVSLYLAPIIGVDYWFSVQMVGVGQLIACYVIGLPLLLLLSRRRLLPETIA